MRIKFEPRDIWIGLYWTKVYEYKNEDGERMKWNYRFYLCLIPFFPIIWDGERKLIPYVHEVYP